MANSLIFELGFDWNATASEQVRDGVYPLPVYLINSGPIGGKQPPPTLISPSNSTAIQVGDQLSFVIYDFTDPSVGEPKDVKPCALQILFTSAVRSGGAPFSPLKSGSSQKAQLVTTSFTTTNTPSVAFNSTNGWTTKIGGTIATAGRFKFRALLTVAVPGAMAMFYRGDPEMVIGDGGG